MTPQDVIGLQECNRFESDWLPAMKKRGYDGFHAPKSQGPAATCGAAPDGVAM